LGESGRGTWHDFYVPVETLIIGLAGLAVLAFTVYTALGRGGELPAERADYAPLELGPVSATDIALFRPSSAMWGYDMQVTDEALERIAGSIRERDVRIVALEQLVTDLSRDSALVPPGRGPLPGARHRRIPGAATTSPGSAVPSTVFTPLTPAVPGTPPAPNIPVPLAPNPPAASPAAGLSASFAPSDPSTSPASAALPGPDAPTIPEIPIVSEIQPFPGALAAAPTSEPGRDPASAENRPEAKDRSEAEGRPEARDRLEAEGRPEAEEPQPQPPSPERFDD
jgi:hypothetical protein